MKKIIVLSIVLVLVGSVVFADVPEALSLSAWGRIAFSPIIGATWKEGNDTKSENYVGVGTSWGTNGRVGFGFAGNWDVVGFQFDIHVDDGDVKLNDQAQIWAKPFGSDVFAIRLGKIYVDDLRGKVGNLNSGFEHFTYTQGQEEDGIFQRFNPNFGAVISTAPVDGLFIAAGIDVTDLSDSKNKKWGSLFGGPYGAGEALAENVYKNIQIGAGYQIANIGHIRAQYIGNFPSGLTVDWTLIPSGEFQKMVTGASLDDKGRIEVAFAFTMLPGVLVDLGGKFKLGVTEDQDIGGANATVKASNGAEINLGAKCDIGALGIGATVQTAFGRNASVELGGQTYEYKDGFGLNIHLNPTYDLSSFGLESTKVGLDFGFASKSKETFDGTDIYTNWSQLGFGLYLEKGLGNGKIMAGLALQLPKTSGKDNDRDPGSAQVFSIPIILEYWL